MHVCVFVCARVFVCVCLCLCVCACVCVCVHVYLHVYTIPRNTVGFAVHVVSLRNPMIFVNKEI